MICITDKCGQFSERCPTPLTCSGSVAETDTAIASIRLHRVSVQAEPELGTQEETFASMADLWSAVVFVAACIVLAYVLFLSAGVEWVELIRAWV